MQELYIFCYVNEFVVKLREMQIESKVKHASDDQLKAIEEKQSEQCSSNHSNNRHVVPFGILMVLCTAYLTFSGLHTNYTYYFKPGVAAFKLSEPHVDFQDENQALENLQQPSCSKIEVFTKKDVNALSRNNQTIKKQKHSKSSKSASSGLVSVNNKQSKTGHKKKDNSKKVNTAEPIIYLFALVFIYLLLKAASDINQHYKSQNKGDKRLRRCSLQSYAQTHQDRRASKDFSMQGKHNAFSELRSVSLDRYNYPISREVEYTIPNEMPNSMRKQNSLGDQPRTYHGKPMHPVINNLQMADARSEPRACRRLSVPISINYQTIHVSKALPPNLARRDSNTNLFGSVTDLSCLNWPLPAANVQAIDAKRRVRMINRH